MLWLLLFGFVTQSIGSKYGVPYLFLYPEYFGKVSFWSYAILGFGLGGFITAFNLYSYTMHAYRFPFIATLSRPRAVVVDGELAVRSTMKLTCAFDHRVADGAQVAGFLTEVRALIKAPETALLDL